MAIWQIFKVTRKTFFNPTAWADVESIKNTNRTLWGNIKGLFIVPKPARQETFEQAMKRQKLTEQDVKLIGRDYLIYAICFLILGIILFLFSFYLLFIHYTLHGWIIGLAVTALLLSQAFKYHFWYFQMKHRKLGCTFAEWRRGKINKADV